MLPKSLRPLYPYLKKYRAGFLQGGLCVLLLNGIWVLFPQVIQRGVDYLKDGGRSTRQLAFYAFLLVVIALTKGVFQFLTRWIVIGISREIEFDLRNDLFEHLEGLSYSFYQRTRTGDVMARATNDLNAVRMLLGPAIMYSANTMVFTAAALAFMFKISPKLTMYAFLPLPVASIVIQYFGRQIHERFEKIQAMFSDISARAQENFSGARVIRAFVQEEPEIRAFEAANQEYIARSLRLVRLMGMLWPTLELMLGFAVVLVLWLGGREVLNGKITVGQFVAFLTYITQLTWPVIALGYVINLFQRGTASLVRINEIMTEQPEISDSPEVLAASASGIELRGEIEFRGLTFAYNGTTVLHDINLHVAAGTSLAIVGPTGSGKTTLVNLIPRAYDAAPGTVLIDGRPIREYPIPFLRRNIGFVPQETFLFSDTIRENIAFGRDDASDADIYNAAEAANIAADIEGFPEGLRHYGWGTRHYAVGRAEAAHGYCTGYRPESTHFDPGRRAVQCRHTYRRQNSQPPARDHARTDHDLHLASCFDRSQCGSHRRVAWRPDRRVGNARRTDRAQWVLHRSCTTSNCWKRNWRKCSS